MTSLSDGFARVDSATLGGTWTESTNGHKIVSGAAVPETTATNVSQLSAALATGNHEAEIEIGNSYGGSFVGVACRMPALGADGTSTGAYYLFLSSGSTGTAFSIRRKEANATTVSSLSTGNTASAARNDGDLWRLRVVDDPADSSRVLLSGFVNDVLIVSAVDTSGSVPSTQRRVGIYSGGSTAPSMRFAAITATDVTVGPPPDTDPPTVPAGVTANQSGPTAVTVSWSPSNLGPVSYRVRRGGSDLSGATAVTGTSFVDNTTTTSGNYTYTVSAVDAAGNRSAESTPATAVVTVDDGPPVDTTPPPVPTGLAATAGENQVALSWGASAASDLAGYRLYRWTTAAPTHVLLASPTTTTYVDAGLSAGTVYSYEVKAYDTSANVSAASTSVSATPTSPPNPPVGRFTLWTGAGEIPLTLDGIVSPGSPGGTADVVSVEVVGGTIVNPGVQAPPTGLTATRTGTSTVTVAWVAPAGTAPASYRVRRNGSDLAGATAVTGTSFVDSTATTGTYTYTVSALSSTAVRSVESAAVTVTVPPPALAAPTGLAATLGATDRVTLAWSAVTNATSYLVFDNRSGTTPIATVTAPAYTTGVLADTPNPVYSFTVLARAAGFTDSARSSSVTVDVTDNDGGGGNPVGTTASLLAGALTTTGFTVAARTTGGAAVRVAVSTSAALTNPVYSASVTPDSAGYVKATVTGLAANTQYYYGLELGSGIYTALTAKVKTAPTGGSFTFAFGSCDNGGGSSAVYNRVIARAPLFFLSQGDFFYGDNTAASENVFHTKWNAYLNAAAGAMLRNTAFAYTWSDHDFGNNNSVGTTGAGATSRPYAQSSYRKRMAHYTLPSGTGGIYQTFVVGRVRFILADTRSYKSGQTVTDNSSKTVLGAEQKAWFKNTITAAAEPLILVVFDQPWSNYGAADDEWPNYNTERTELANFMKVSGKNIEIICGDMHALAYDDGTHSLGIPVMHAAPVHQGASKKVDAMTLGPSPSSGTVEQYGVVEIIDSGGATITRRFTGYNNSNAVAMTNTKTYNIDGSGSDPVSGFVETTV